MKEIFLFILSGVILFYACNNATDHQEQAPDAHNKSVAWQMPDTAAYKKYGNAKLSDYGFFKGTLSELIPAEGVVHYDINSPLFSDYALKKRLIYLPEGTSLIYHDRDVLEFPVGAVLIKNFYFDGKQMGATNQRIIETRLLIKEEDGWKALPYLWNKEQTEAYLEITGREMPVQLANVGTINYSVPNMLQCKSCHDKNGEIVPIGPSARQLNKDHPDGGGNQLSMLISKGALKNAPSRDNWPSLVQWENPSMPLDSRARAYLEVNCAHCHQDGGPAKTSGLDLTASATDSHAMGIYKAPVAAGKGSGGLKYDIVPGYPEKSILIYRMESTDPAVMMPELGRSIIHKEGVELIRKWIVSLNEEQP